MTVVRVVILPPGLMKAIVAFGLRDPIALQIVEIESGKIGADFLMIIS
jgi:hypothetical protein